MRDSNVPALDGRYWAALLIASVFGMSCSLMRRDADTFVCGGWYPTQLKFSIALW